MPETYLIRLTGWGGDGHGRWHLMSTRYKPLCNCNAYWNQEIREMTLAEFEASDVSPKCARCIAIAHKRENEGRAK